MGLVHDTRRISTGADGSAPVLIGALTVHRITVVDAIGAVCIMKYLPARLAPSHGGTRYWPALRGTGTESTCVPHHCDKRRRRQAAESADLQRTMRESATGLTFARTASGSRCPLAFITEVRCTIS